LDFPPLGLHFHSYHFHFHFHLGGVHWLEVSLDDGYFLAYLLSRVDNLNADAVLGNACLDFGQDNDPSSQVFHETVVSLVAAVAAAAGVAVDNTGKNKHQ